MRISERLTACAGVALSILIGAPSIHAAALIVVTTTAPGVAADGLCSLAEAIHNANASAAVHADCAAGSNPTTIELSPAAVYTISVPHSALDDGTGLPQVTATIVVNGHGAIIERASADGTPPFRLMAVMPGGVLTLNEVTLRGGLANGDGTGLGGGALLNAGTATLVSSIVDSNRSGTNGGGLSNFASLAVRDSRIQNNVAVSAGGGLRNDVGTATVERTVVTANRSTGDAGRGGGIANHAASGNATLSVAGGEITANLTAGVGGAGIDNAAAPGRTATATIIGATIRGNTAAGPDHTRGLGGGIQNSFFRNVTTAGAARVTVDRSVITENNAVNGGGISSGFDLPGARELIVTITRSEVSGNSASGSGFQMGNGGGVYVLNGKANIANSTISGNEALGTGSLISGLGGGVLNGGLGGGTGETTVLNSTITGNLAVTIGGGVLATPFNGFAVTSIGSSIVASNSSPAGAGCGVISSSITSLGSNVESGNTCSFVQSSDKVNSNPLLGPLAANGAATRTHALLPGSPAIDAGDPVVCAAPPVGAVDQRGQPRPAGLGCDAGAYESAWAASALILNTTFSLSDGTKGTGRFALLADATMVDEAGGTGFWWIPQPGVLAIVTNATPRIVWVALFTSPTTVSGRVIGLDGSTLTGGWTGTRAN